MLALTSLAAIVIGGGGLIAMLIHLAIFAVIIWGIWAILQWAGVTIPRPIQILLIVIVVIIVLLYLAQLAGYAL